MPRPGASGSSRPPPANSTGGDIPQANAGNREGRDGKHGLEDAIAAAMPIAVSNALVRTRGTAPNCIEPVAGAK